MPIYDCGDPECTECERAFGPNRAKAMTEYREKSRRWSKHTHTAGTTHGRDIDECAFCGLDLRHPIHAGHPECVTPQDTTPPDLKAILAEALAENVRLRADNLTLHQRLARWTDNA